MFLLLTLVLISIVLYTMQYYYHLIRGLFLLWKIPGPSSYPIIGSAHLLINKTSTGVSNVYVCVFVHAFKS